MINLILNQNPWWRDKSLISQDPKLRELERRPLRFRPELLDEFDLDVKNKLARIIRSDIPWLWGNYMLEKNKLNQLNKEIRSQKKYQFIIDHSKEP